MSFTSFATNVCATSVSIEMNMVRIDMNLKARGTLDHAVVKLPWLPPHILNNNGNYNIYI